MTVEHQTASSELNASANGRSSPSEAVSQDKLPRAFPHTLTILLLVTVIVWVAALFIPSGQYQLDEDGRPIAGSYKQIESPLTFPERVTDLLLAPINGLYGVKDPETGQIGPFNSGDLFGAAQVFVFILTIGGFMTVVFATGALDLGIAHLAHRFRAQGTTLIVTLSVLFALLGSVMSWSDETLGMYPLLIPLMLALGYDRMVALSVIFVAPSAGIIGSTVNPFKIGIGADAAAISLGDGIGLRLLLLVLATAAMIVYTVRYANRVKADASKSLVGITQADAELARQGTRDDLEPLSLRHKIVIGIVAFTFLLLTFSIIPWGSILHNTLVDPETHETITEAFAWELGWWLPELSVMFCVMAIIVGIVARLGEPATARAFVKGLVDFTGPAILVAVARGVAVILNNTQSIDTRAVLDGTHRGGHLQRDIRERTVDRDDSAVVPRRSRIRRERAHHADLRAARRFRGHRSRIDRHRVQRDRRVVRQCPADQCHLDGGARSRVRRLQQVHQVHAAAARHLARDHACRIRHRGDLMRAHSRASRRR